MHPVAQQQHPLPRLQRIFRVFAVKGTKRKVSNFRMIAKDIWASKGMHQKKLRISLDWD